MKNMIRKIILGTVITGLVVASPLSVRRVYAEKIKCNVTYDTPGHTNHIYMR